MKKQLIIIALSTLVLSSCGMYTKYQRPTDISVEGLYGSAQSGDSVGVGAKAWREFFTDPTLQALIDSALHKNSSLRQVDNQILESQAYLKVSKLAYIPALQFTPSGTLSAWDWNSPSKIYSLPVSASWQIGSLGYLRNNKWKAEVGLQQVQEARQAVQQSLVANIANLYYTLCMLDAELAVSEETVVKWRKLLQHTKDLMNAGRSNKAAVAQYEANCYSVESSVLDLKQAITEAENALCTILGEAPHHIERQSLATFVAPAQMETGIPMLLLSNRPDVKQSELALASAYYDVHIARSSFYPSLNITGTLGFTNSAGSVIINPGKFIWNAVASLAQPIFQNGRLRAQYKVAKLEEENKRLDFCQTLIAAGNEVNTAVTKLQTVQGKKQFIVGQVQSLQDAVTATEALFLNSTSVNYLNVLTAQTSLLSAQLGQISNDYAEIQATIQLYQALGGGSLAEVSAER